MASPSVPHAPEPVLVTGATGLLGRHLVEALLRAGDEVRVLVRDRREAPEGCDVVVGDVGDSSLLRAAVRSARAVYHLAAVTQKWLRDAREFERVNVEATFRLARLAAEAGVERFVHASSFTVFGPSGGAPGEPELKNESVLAGEGQLHNDYQRSKYHAHVGLAGLARRAGVPVVLACPGVVYGTGPRHLRNPIADLMRRQLNRRLRFFPGLDRLWSLAWAPDVAAGLRLVRERGVVGESYLLGGDVASVRDVSARVASWSGKAGPRSLPLLPFSVLGYLAQGAARVLRTRKPPRFSAAALRFLRHSWAFSSAKAEALGYRASRLDDCLRAIWSDLHAQHLVPDLPAAVPAA